MMMTMIMLMIILMTMDDVMKRAEWSGVKHGVEGEGSKRHQWPGRMENG